MPQPVALGVDAFGSTQSVTPMMRSMHMHVIGATGQGKSKFLAQLIRQDIKHRHGVCLIDPHGTLYREIIAWCSYHGLQGRRRIHLIDPNDTDWTLGFDPLRCDDPEYLSVTVDGAVEACAQVWGGEDSNRTPLLKKCLRAVFYALAVGGQSLGEAFSLTTVNDRDGFRAKVAGRLDDEIYQRVWDDLNSLSNRDFAEAFSSTNNRLMEFLANPAIRRMFRLKEKALDIAKCMEEGDIILVNLQAKKISNDNARLIGTLLTNCLFNAAIRRDERSAIRHPFYLYIDECYRFLTSDVESMLDQTRKFGLHVTLAHQHLGQLMKYGDHIYDAVMTNARTKVVFGGLSEKDGELLAKELLRETFDFNRPKEILNKPVVVGYETATLNSRTMTRGAATTQGQSSLQADGMGSNSGMGVMQTFGPDGLPISIGYSGSSTSGMSSSSSTARGTMNANSSSSAVSEGVSETLRPILEILPTTVEGQEEILHRAILAIRKLPKRAFFLAQPDMPVALLVTPTVKEVAVSPRTIADFSNQSRLSSPYMATRQEADVLISKRLNGKEDLTEHSVDDNFSVPEG